MRYATVRSTTMRMLLASFALVMVMFAISASHASAQTVEFEGKKLPGKVWTCGHCIEQKKLFVVKAGANTTSSVCAGAVQYNGSSWYEPYGWLCGREEETYYFSAIQAFAAIYNPNPGTFEKYYFAGVST
jgi:hypothetical protein